jgi:hypothetical protein
MPSPLFQSLVKTVSDFTGPEKAAGAIERRLKDCSATPDSFGKEHLQKILPQLIVAAGLYVTDAAKKDQLAAKIKALAC